MIPAHASKVRHRLTGVARETPGMAILTRIKGTGETLGGLIDVGNPRVLD